MSAKPVVILLHGFSASKWHMRPWRVFLERRGYKVVDFEYKSFFQNFGQVVDAFNNAVSDHKPNLVIGWSLGGVVAAASSFSGPILTLSSPIGRELKVWRGLPGFHILKQARTTVAKDNMFVVGASRDLIVKPNGTEHLIVSGDHFSIVAAPSTIRTIFSAWQDSM